MSAPQSLRVIIDTNIWISFLIGKKLQFIKDLIIDRQIIIILSAQLLQELWMVTQRPKLKKYFPGNRVDELIEFLLIVGQKVETTSVYQLSRDPKDNFLLDLAHQSHADYLVTGDKDLLVLNPFSTTQILTPAEFEKEMKKTDM